MKLLNSRDGLLAALAGFALLAVTIAWGGNLRAASEALEGKERIGLYDSRAIAVAYAGSPANEKRLQALMAEYKQTKEAGDREKMAKLEAEGKAQQKKMHLQGFGTAAVDDLLGAIAVALPQIQKEAGVSALVSKWDEAELKKHAGAERVEVTMKLVDAFKPSERARKSAIQIQNIKPISAEEAAKIEN
jgi:hypothetical protein